MAAILAIVGALLVVVGVACIYWPAAFVVAGLFVLGFGVLWDLVEAGE
jgi:hypothetical protein